MKKQKATIGWCGLCTGLSDVQGSLSSLLRQGWGSHWADRIISCCTKNSSSCSMMIFRTCSDRITLWFLKSAHDCRVSDLELVTPSWLLSRLLIIARVYTLIRREQVTLWTRQRLIRLVMNVVHCSWGLLVRVVQKLLRLTFLDSDIRLLLISVVSGLVVEPTLRHVPTASLTVYLKSHIIIVLKLWSPCCCIKLTLTLLSTCNNVTKILRVLSLIGLGRINRVTEKSFVRSVHCWLNKRILQSVT